MISYVTKCHNLTDCLFACQLPIPTPRFCILKRTFRRLCPTPGMRRTESGGVRSTSIWKMIPYRWWSQSIRTVASLKVPVILQEISCECNSDLNVLLFMYFYCIQDSNRLNNTKSLQTVPFTELGWDSDSYFGSHCSVVVPCDRNTYSSPACATTSPRWWPVLQHFPFQHQPTDGAVLTFIHLDQLWLFYKEFSHKTWGAAQWLCHCTWWPLQQPPRTGRQSVSFKRSFFLGGGGFLCKIVLACF